ncbi:flavin reductase family protein [Neorhizobium alkalisoli]|uniref:Flavin reductase (DIM6/NTAB) family NADH-FMN oxidoreductase RutF n=1 Tax=Neorhizobium alkalisoli TaxID=528178 RepID=A0A561R752_9HYPH|nr:flavin reductase family protein [Neorhizobium alkalisoli]TWF58430.1 flavin reductase (DIM6/NTAB) family NADH-FMN oxidoreductase RutF [Neorhizobium alkalisoli]
MNGHIKPVDLSRASRLVNHGPTVLVSARHGGVDNVMAVAWCCGLDFDPPKLTVVLDRIAHTRSLVEASGKFVVHVPNVAQLQLTEDLGTHSFYDDPGKLAAAGATLFDIPGHDLPFVEGCSAWLACELIREPHIEDAYDLFLGQVTEAWADDRVFRNGHWHFETAGPEWRSLHHVAGGHYYAIGEAMDAVRKPD